MGRAGRACKFLGTIFIFSLLVQGICAAHANNETNTNLNDTVNGIANGTINKIHPFQWVLILPILVGYLIFLCWMCRFFDRMNFCFVVFILLALLLWLLPLNLISTIIRYFFVIVLLFILGVIIYYDVFSKRKKENESNPIMNLHDIVRNFIVISAILIWPMMLFYFYQHDIENITFYGIEELEFPIYIIFASTAGVISYLLLSIEETYRQLIPEYKKMNIAWSYVRRILIAPFIALIGIYALPFQNPTGIDPKNEIFIFIFSFFAGFFTKSVEKWVYLGVQTLLPKYDKDELKFRTEYDVEESDFVKILGTDEDLACMLYNAKIRTIEELASFNNNMDLLLKKVNLDTRNLGEGTSGLLKKQEGRVSSYSINQIRLYIDKAQDYMHMDESEFVTKLKMNKDLAFKLHYFANIKTIDDLIKCDPKKAFEKICDCKKKAEALARQNNIESKDAYKKLCGCSEEEIEEFKKIAEEEFKKIAEEEFKKIAEEEWKK